MHIVTQRLKETVQNRHNLSEIAEEIAANRARMQKKIAANKAQMQKKSPLTRRKKEYRREGKIAANQRKWKDQTPYI